MLPYAKLVQALATVPRVTLHGPWSRTIDHALLNAPLPRLKPGAIDSGRLRRREAAA